MWSCLRALHLRRNMTRFRPLNTLLAVRSRKRRRPRPVEEQHGPARVGNAVHRRRDIGDSARARGGGGAAAAAHRLAAGGVEAGDAAHLRRRQLRPRPFGTHLPIPAPRWPREETIEK